jgi:hypothetical protein
MPQFQTILLLMVSILIAGLITSPAYTLLTEEEQELVDQLNNTDWQSRESALFQLKGKVADEEVYPLFVAALQDIHPNVRQTALNALAAVKTDENQEVIITMLEDPLWYIRVDAINILQGFPNERSLEALEPLKNDSHPYVQRRIEPVIKAIQNAMIKPRHVIGGGIAPLSWDSKITQLHVGYNFFFKTKNKGGKLEFTITFSHHYQAKKAENFDNFWDFFKGENIVKNDIDLFMSFDRNKLRDHWTPFIFNRNYHKVNIRFGMEIGPGIKYDFLETKVVPDLSLSFAPIFNWENRLQDGTNQNKLTGRGSLRFRFKLRPVDLFSIDMEVYYKPALYSYETKSVNFYDYKVEGNITSTTKITQNLNFLFTFRYTLDTENPPAQPRDIFYLEGRLNFVVDL